VGWNELPAVNKWQHIAFVYSGGYRGTFTVFLNGKKVNDRGFFTLDTTGGFPMHLGAAWNTARGAVTPFSGSLSQLRVYDYARSEEQIRASAR
jgi:hypothetical protein